MATDISSTIPKQGMDQAYDFLTRTGASVSYDDTSHIELRRLRRKVDWRIVPLMFACYTLSFIDKVVLNVRLP